MVHIKRFNESSKLNEEFFGGSVKDSMNSKVDKLIEFLRNYKFDINNPRKVIDEEKTNKIDNMYSYIISLNDLDTISKSNRQGKKVRGKGETFPQKIKRTFKNF